VTKQAFAPALASFFLGALISKEDVAAALESM
jgi:hypothetical protein